MNRKRVLMLAAAGLLFGATAFGWVQHMQTAARRAALTTAATASSSTAAPSAQPKADAQAAAATNDVPAAKPARDPMTSSEVRAAWPVSAYLAQSEANSRIDSRRRFSDAAFSVPLPPPPDAAAVDSQTQAVGHEAPPVPLPEAVRLVGVMDGKAIFTVPADVANRNNVTTSFTLGPGQKYAGITVQDVKAHSVTICDGKSICIKSLSDLQ